MDKAVNCCLYPYATVSHSAPHCLSYRLLSPPTGDCRKLLYFVLILNTTGGGTWAL